MPAGVMMPSPVGARIKALRESRGLYQKELAAEAKVPRTWLSVVETGDIENPSAARLDRVAAALGVSARYLLTGETEEPSVDDPELDLLFHQLRTAELPESDLRYVKETIKLALQLRREREAAGGNG